MRRILAIVLGVVVVALGCGFLALGAFPPKPPVQTVRETISNDRLEQANAPPVPVLPPVPMPASTATPGPVPVPVPTPGPVPAPVPAPALIPVPAPATMTVPAPASGTPPH